MESVLLCLGVTAFCTGLLSILIWDCIRNASCVQCIAILLTIVCLAATSYVGAQVQKGESFDQTVWQLLAEGKPKPAITMVAGVIVGAGLGVLIVLAGRSVSRQNTMHLWISAVTCITVLMATGPALLLAWDDAFDIERFQPSVLDNSWQIEEIAKTEQLPIRLAWDEERQVLYFSTFSTSINGVYNGSIYSLPIQEESGKVVPTLAITSAALYRPFGLTCRDGDVFVSRAGHAARAVRGQVEYLNLGSVTRLKDLDGDGQFEFLEDIIEGIPAARGPDTMHQNNGIAFDSLGNLYVAIGSADDRSVDQHPWSGTVLKLGQGQSEPEIYARGLRNPFGICCGIADSIFVTDNDCAEDPGDEINFVQRDGHYGHPFAIPGEDRTVGFDDPLLVGNSSNYCGIAWMNAADDAAGEGDLFVCDRLQNSVLRLRVMVKDNRCEIVENQVFARVPSPVDLVITPAGEIFVASLSKQKIYRVRLKR